MFPEAIATEEQKKEKVTHVPEGFGRLLFPGIYQQAFFGYTFFSESPSSEGMSQ